MTKYVVNLVNVANYTAEVEADSEEEAIDFAFNEAPRENIHTGFEIGDWMLSSELFPETSKPEDDVQVAE